MSYEEVLSKLRVAISISESDDMAILGLSEDHLRDGMSEVARHLLALGARLSYGGDLRRHGFTELLLELIARHLRDADEGEAGSAVSNYLAWPVICRQSFDCLQSAREEMDRVVDMIYLSEDGASLQLDQLRTIQAREPTAQEWSAGLTAMRVRMLQESSARIVLGGRTQGYMGAMPGVAEEALLSLRSGQPLYVLGGFGGCARSIAEQLGLSPAMRIPCAYWEGQKDFSGFSWQHMNNGLTEQECETLAFTPHVDQAVMLVLRGLTRVARCS